MRYSKLGIALLAFLLLLGCSGQERKSLVLIFENPEPYEPGAVKFSSTYVYQSIKNQNVLFVDDGGVAYKFMVTKPYDTLVITSTNRSTVELSHYYHHYIYTEHVLLQAEDTVLIRYNGTAKPTYTSLCSEENTQLYGLRNVVLKDFLYDNPEFKNELRRSYLAGYMRRKNPDSHLFRDYPDPDELAAEHNLSLPKVEHTLDSLVAQGLLPADYETYYRYYLRRAEVIPFYERQITDVEFALTPEQYAFFNDSLTGFISYREYLINCTDAFAQNGTEWEIPRFDAVNAYNGKPLRLKDHRAIFDRLVEMQQGGDSRISDMSYDLMRLFCVDVITNFGHHSEEDAATYLAKYTGLSTRFLVQEPEKVGSFWGFPFRLLIFVLQLNIYIGIFYSLYRLLLYNTTSFVFCRVFLLSGIVLSLVAAFGWVGTEVLIPDSLLRIGQEVKLIGWLILGLYGLCALNLLYGVGRQLAHVWVLRRDSWRINEGNYFLYILKDIVASPSTFFRMVFISWGDFFNARNHDHRDRLLAHEEYHVKAWHSIDATLLVLMRVLCWFNPLFSKYAKELKLVNEYAADRSVVREMGITAYMRAIVDNTTQQAAYELLSYSADGRKAMDKRVKMIRRYDEVSYHSLLGLLLIIPVFILLAYFSPEFVVKNFSLPEVLTTLF